MIILGKNTDDVGAQLEKLTKRLLESRGFKNVITDTIGDGGNEIDVQGEFPSPVLGSPASRRLIAECKALATPINLPDWLKFLGKVFVEEAKLGNDVDGLFVALSGANGAVRGNFDSLKQRKQHITLLEGETLTDALSKLYNLPPAAEVIGKLRQFTDRLYSSMELAYHGEKFFWVFMFPERDVAVLNQSGEPITSSTLGELSAPLLKRIDARNLLDLPAEKLAMERSRDAQKFLLTSIVNSGGNLRLTFVAIEQGGFTVAELQAALQKCEGNGWVVASAGDTVTTTFNATSGTDKLFDALRFLLSEGVKRDDWTRLVTSKFFDELLNDLFVDQVGVVQGNLPLDNDYRTKLRLLTKLSPSALAHAIHPDPMIVTHRIKQPEVKGSDDDDRQFLMRNLLRSVRVDFRHKALANYFFHDCGLREVEVVERYKIKDKTAVRVEHEVKERILIAIADESLGGGLIYVQALSNAPEPWDMPKPADSSQSNATAPTPAS